MHTRQVRSVVATAHEALDKLHAQAQEKQPLSPRRAINEQAVLRVLHEVLPAEQCAQSAPELCLHLKLSWVQLSDQGRGPQGCDTVDPELYVNVSIRDVLGADCLALQVIEHSSGAAAPMAAEPVLEHVAALTAPMAAAGSFEADAWDKVQSCA